MPRQPRMDPDERLTQIVDTASELLSLKGYFGFSVGELAQRCGLSNAGLIHHIGTKQRVLHMVLDARDLAVMAEAAGGVDWEAVEAGCAALDTRTAVAMLHALVEHNEAYRPQGPPTSPCGGWAPPPRHGSLGPCRPVPTAPMTPAASVAARSLRRAPRSGGWALRTAA